MKTAIKISQFASGVFDCAQQIYGSLGPAFYGLRTSLLTLFLVALWRIKRPENLKEYSPQSLGVSWGRRIWLNRELKLWDVLSGNEILTLHGAKSTVYGVAISPDGKTIAAACADGGVVFWSTEPP